MKKRADGRYSRSIVTGYDADGKQLRKTFYATTKVELEKKVREWQELHEKGFDQQSDMTMSKLCDLWYESKLGIVSSQSLDTYAKCVRHLKAEFGQIKVTKLNVSDFVRYRNKMTAEGHLTAFNEYLSAARQVLKYGTMINVVVVNVAERVQMIPNAGKKRRAFTNEEREKILNADLPIFDKTLIYLLFYTGIRRGEAVALEGADIDFLHRLVHINKTVLSNSGEVQNHTKTDAGMRVIPMPDALYDVMKEYVSLNGLGKLFASSTGKNLRTGHWDYHWNRIMRSIFGDEYVTGTITAHMFRHNYCSDLCKAGVPIRTAMYYMGHSSMNMTMELYSHVTEEDVDVTPIMAYYNRRESNRESKVAKAL